MVAGCQGDAHVLTRTAAMTVDGRPTYKDAHYNMQQPSGVYRQSALLGLAYVAIRLYSIIIQRTRTCTSHVCDSDNDNDNVTVNSVYVTRL